jgi:hypothetical protein
MSRFAALLLVLACSVALASAVPIHRLPQTGDDPVPYTFCGSSSDLLTLTSVTSNKWPPIGGKLMIINVAGTVSQTVVDGSYEIKGTAFGIPILDLKGDLSDLVPLPVAAGPVQLTKNESIPAISTTVKLHITAVDNKGNELTCLDVVANIQPGLPLIPQVNVPYKVCGDAATLKMPLLSITADQWPPAKAGESIQLTSTFLPQEDVPKDASSTYHSKVVYSGITFQDKTAELQSVFTDLPAVNGEEYKQTTQLDLPGAMPSGEWTNTISATDKDGNTLFCAEISFDLA